MISNKPQFLLIETLGKKQGLINLNYVVGAVIEKGPNSSWRIAYTLDYQIEGFNSLEITETLEDDEALENRLHLLTL